MRYLSGVLAFLCLVAAAAPAPLLVFGLAHEDEIASGDVATLVDLIGAEVARDPRFAVVTANEIKRAADAAATREAAGCDADQQCVAELADAMGARYVVGGRIARLGDSWVLSLQLVDTRTVKVLSRASVEAPARARLVAATPLLARRVLDFHDEELGGPPLPLAAWGLAGGCALVAALGVGATVLGLGRLDDARALAFDLGSIDDPDEAREKRAAFDEATLAGNALAFGGAAAAALAVAGGATGFVLLGGLE